MTKRKYTPRVPKSHTCTHCNSAFESRSYTANYCSLACKERARYERDREKRMQVMREYRARNAEEIRARTKARREADSEKFARQARESYLRHREERIRDACRYQKENPHVVSRTRNRRRSVEQKLITDRDLRRLLARHHGLCAYCGVTLLPWGRDDNRSLQWDHVVPLFRGGWDSIGNLAPSCRSCNCSKGRKTLVEWRKSQSYNKGSK